MPRPRSAPLFELAGQWIAREPASPYLYRFWNDAGSSRTRRASLGTDNLERAKIIFAKAVLIEGPKTPDSPLSAVLESYFQGRTDKLPSAKHARLAGKTLLKCWGQNVRISQIDEAKQEAFATWSLDRGHSLAYLSRNLSVCSAAFGFAGLGTRIYFGKAQIQERWALSVKAPRKTFIPSDEELARFLSAELPAEFVRWAIMASLTGGRPEAVLDLAPAQRIAGGLIDLNPPGRAQTKKYRPTVREPQALKGWLNKWEKERPKNVEAWRYCMYSSVESVQTAIERARAATGIPMSAYSFRHKLPSVLRAARIPEDMIALQLGHRRPNLSVTLGYGDWPPDYLKPVAKAIDAWWKRVAKKAKRPLFSQVIPKRKIIKLRKAA